MARGVLLGRRLPRILGASGGGGGGGEEMLLLEDGDFVLLEDGSFILLESSGTGGGFPDNMTGASEYQLMFAA